MNVTLMSELTVPESTSSVSKNPRGVRQALGNELKFRNEDHLFFFSVSYMILWWG